MTAVAGSFALLRSSFPSAYIQGQRIHRPVSLILHSPDGIISVPLPQPVMQRFLAISPPLKSSPGWWGGQYARDRPLSRPTVDYRRANVRPFRHRRQHPRREK